MSQKSFKEFDLMELLVCNLQTKDLGKKYDNNELSLKIKENLQIKNLMIWDIKNEYPLPSGKRKLDWKHGAKEVNIKNICIYFMKIVIFLTIWVGIQRKSSITSFLFCKLFQLCVSDPKHKSVLSY